VIHLRRVTRRPLNAKLGTVPRRTLVGTATLDPANREVITGNIPLHGARRRDDHLHGVRHLDVWIVHLPVGLSQGWGALRQEWAVLRKEWAALRQEWAVLRQEWDVLLNEWAALRQEWAVLRRDVRPHSDPDLLLGILRRDVPRRGTRHHGARAARLLDACSPTVLRQDAALQPEQGPGNGDHVTCQPGGHGTGPLQTGQTDNPRKERKENLQKKKIRRRILLRAAVRRTPAVRHQTAIN